LQLIRILITSHIYTILPPTPYRYIITGPVTIPERQNKKNLQLSISISLPVTVPALLNKKLVLYSATRLSHDELGGHFINVAVQLLALDQADQHLGGDVAHFAN
jgi:hypothetical protein